MFEHAALILDTLPLAGRIMLTAVLLALGLVACDHWLRRRGDGRLLLLFRKGGLFALLVLPGAIYGLGMQVSVPVVDMRSLSLMWPTYLSAVLAVVWAAGAIWHLYVLALDLRRVPDAPGHVVSEVLQNRLAHWCGRLNVTPYPELRLGGAQRPWLQRQMAADVPGGNVIVLPAAAQRWPRGVVDVLLLYQLAAVRQRVWWWLLAARLLAAVFWWLPPVREFAASLCTQLLPSVHSLAQSAYRDADGWRRDVRQAQQRLVELDGRPDFMPGKALRMQLGMQLGGLEEPQVPDESQKSADPAAKWARTRARRRYRYRDPYEQAYWLIAMVCIVAWVGSTMTLTQAPPQFEPEYLKVKWQDQMMRRLHDEGSKT